MSAVSILPPERTRKAVQTVLLRLQEAGTASVVAAAMGVSETTVSRIKNDQLEDAVLLLAHLGFKVVASDQKCVHPAAYEFLVESHRRVVERAPELIWDEEE